MSFKKVFSDNQNNQPTKQNTCGTGDDSAVSLFGRFSSCFVEQAVLSWKTCDWKKVNEVKWRKGTENLLEIFPLVNFLHFDTSWKVKRGTKWSQHDWDPRERAIIHSPFGGLSHAYDRQLLKKKKSSIPVKNSLQKILKNKELHNYYILLSLMYLDSKI